MERNRTKKKLKRLLLKQVGKEIRVYKIVQRYNKAMPERIGTIKNTSLSDWLNKTCPEK